MAGREGGGKKPPTNGGDHRHQMRWCGDRVRKRARKKSVAVDADALKGEGEERERRHQKINLVT